MGRKSGQKGRCFRIVLICWASALLVLFVFFNIRLSPNTSTASISPSDLDQAEPSRSRYLRSGGADSSSADVGETDVNVQRQPPQSLEDNAPRPPPRPGDYEIVSQTAHVLPGASDDHLHGLLGLLPNGEQRVKPTPLPQGGLSNDEKRMAHRGQCYNAWQSNALSVDRGQPDVRSDVCKKERSSYPSNEDLGSGSIVIVFHNEIFTVLLRSVHSVLNHSPPELLKEIILVDDASTPDPTRYTDEQWKSMQEPLSEYLQTLPKVTLVRLKERRGLMLARMEGAWRASGKVLIFLDSHIEATKGWIEPLLARIHEDYRHVVVPSIGSIDYDSFDFEGGGALGVVGFTWTLGQNPSGSFGSKIQKSPIMAGGLFASDRAFFMHLGGYDSGMRYYGGEEMEIGFRTWQCGGDIEFLPCSHVFHVFRRSVFWQGTDSGGVAYKVPAMDITRNKLRTAAVWMDEYAKLVEYASPPLPQGWDLGDLTDRRKLREKLQCKSFKWYMRYAAPGTFSPETDGLRAGALVNRKLNGCIDTLGGNSPGLYPCHWQHGTQGLVLDGHSLVRIPLLLYRDCLGIHAENRRLELRKCPTGQSLPQDMVWKLDERSGIFHDGTHRNCLEGREKSTPKSPLDVAVVDCDEKNPLQQWSWHNW